MKQRSLVLGFSLPLALVGCLAGHASAYALVGSRRQDALAHGYLAYAPQFVAVCGAAVALTVALRSTGALRGRVAAWPFALVPPLAFAAQELVERIVAGIPAHTVLEPAVYVGLAAQLPIALIAYLVARALLRAADTAARDCSPAASTPLELGILVPLPPVPNLSRAPLAAHRLGRAPPLR